MTTNELRTYADWLSNLNHYVCPTAAGHLRDAADQIDQLQEQVVKLTAFAAELWEQERFLAQKTAECNDEDHAAWASKLIADAEGLGIDAALEAK